MGRKTTKPISRTPNLQQVANMDDFLSQMRSSGSVHFVKALSKSALPRPGVTQTARFYLPSPFVEDHADKVEELVTLRVRTSRRRSSRSWLVQFCVRVTPRVTEVYSTGGWPAFVVDNRLKLGDFVVFVLRADARSEFEVFVFRGPRAFPYFPDREERSDEDEESEENVSSDSEEEETNNQSPLASPVHQQDGHNQAFRGDTREESPAPFQHTGDPRVPLRSFKRLKVLHQQDGHDQAFRGDTREETPAPFQHTGSPRAPPRFSKRLKASHIRGSSGDAGQYEFPNGFIRVHGEQVRGAVKLQGIHENSRNYVMLCHRRPKNLCKVYFSPTDWSRFVHDNDLKEGEELQFTLMADSYFLVRRIS